MGKRRVVTICGSLKFIDKITEISERLVLENGWVILTPHALERKPTESEKNLLGELHKEKIALSDAIFVVNVGGYIGESVRAEIEYAKNLGKDIIYLEN